MLDFPCWISHHFPAYKFEPSSRSAGLQLPSCVNMASWETPELNGYKWSLFFLKTIELNGVSEYLSF